MTATARPVLLLNLYYHGGIGVVRTLGRLGVPVHAIHHDVTVPAARSRYLREVMQWDFEAEPNERSLEFVLDAGRSLGDPSVLVAADDTAQAFVAENAEALHDVFTLPRQPAGLTEQLYSKRGLYELCSEHGVPSPQTAFPQNREEAREALTAATFPLMLKPIDKVRFERRNGISMFIARDATEALDAYDRLEDPQAPNLMLQDYIPGPSSSVWVFTGYFDERSELVFGAGGTKLRQYPIRVGTTCFGDVRANPEMEAETARFVKALGYSGVFDCGWRYDRRDGKYKLLDAHPRVGANFRQCVGRDDLDVVKAMYLDLTGQQVPPDEPAEGRVWWVENYDIAAAIDSARAGEMSIREWLRSLRAVDEPAWFDRDDRAPFRAMCVGALGAVARRASRASTHRSDGSQDEAQEVTNAYFGERVEYWDEVYEDEGVEGLVYRERLETVLRFVDKLGLPAGSRALDVGCGAGLASVELARRGLSVEATDSSGEMVERASRRLRGAGLDGRVGVADAHALPYPDGSFAVVVAVGILPWLHSPEQALGEFARVLEPGGHLILTADNRSRLNILVDPTENPLLEPLKAPWRALRRRLGWQPPAGPLISHHRPAEVGRMLTNAGLLLERRTTIGFGPFTFRRRPLLRDRASVRVHRRMQRLADHGARGFRGRGWHYVVAARTSTADASKDAGDTEAVA